jgi:RNA polymerase sigma factor (sigma-70 family)
MAKELTRAVTIGRIRLTRGRRVAIKVVAGRYVCNDRPPDACERAMTLTEEKARMPVTGAAAGVVSDEALLQRLRDGDASAGDALVRRYAQPLMRYLQRLTRSNHLAEELHQQTWLSVLDNLEKFDAASSAGGGFKAWLFRIATNKANDHWRSRGREKVATEGLRLVTDQESPAAGIRLEGTEQQEKLSRAIAQLPENQRQVVLLRYYSNLKFIEIAKMLGCPLNTALGRMHKAVTKLKQLME